ncbi:MAG: hypothetical protein RL154_898 [Pseudomonadota bacterium]|jgi:methyl-accepting chemotaxis protein
MKIRGKLYAGFLSIVIAFMLFAIYEIFQIHKLGVLQDDGAKRGNDALLVMENQKMLSDLYVIVADAVINGYSEETKKELASIKKEFEEGIKTIESNMDTPEEQQLVREYSSSLKEYINVIENEMLVRLTKKSSNIDSEIKDIDDKIDKAREASSKVLAKISKSLKNEMDNGDEVFDTTRKSIFSITIGAGIIIGMLATIIAFILSKNIVSSLQSLRKIAGELASGDGDLTKRLEVKSKDELGEASEEVNQFIDKTHSIISSAKITANENASVAEELSATSMQVGRRVEDSTKIVSNVNDKVKQIVNDIKKSVDMASNAKKEVKKADEMLTISKIEITAMIEQISKSVEIEIEFSERLSRLTLDAEQVKGVLSVIGDIADQTNLLALNAAIEAARAGEHGRGFAVVADEVRKLAERTQKSLVETNATISTIVQSIGDASQQMEKNAESVKHLGESSEKVGHHISESAKIISETHTIVGMLASSAVEISSNADNVGLDITKIDTISIENARSIEEIATAINHLSHMTEKLEKMLGHFKT